MTSTLHRVLAKDLSALHRQFFRAVKAERSATASGHYLITIDWSDIGGSAKTGDRDETHLAIGRRLVILSLAGHSFLLSSFTPMNSSERIADGLSPSRPRPIYRTDGALLELRLAGPRAPWELNNKCLKLRSSVRRIADQHDGASDVGEALDRLLGIRNGSIEWGYLNATGGVKL